MKYYHAIIMFFLLTLIGLTACSGETVEVSKDTNQLLVFPTPTSGKAVIYGILLNENTEKPISGVPFLAQALNSDNPDVPITISFSYQNAPGADYDKNTGSFYFENIDPGEHYAIIVISGPGKNIVIKEPGTELPLLLSVSADEVLDIGKITVQE